MNNYNWLFDSPAEVNIDVAAKSRGLDMLSNSMKMPIGFNEADDQQVMVTNFTPPNSFADFEMSRSNDAMSWDALAQETTVCQPQTMSGGQVPNRLANSPYNQLPRSSNKAASTRRQQAYPEPSIDTPVSIKSSSTTSNIISTSEPVAPQPQINYERETIPRTSSNTSAAPASHTQNTPIMDNDSRGRILDLLTAARPLMPANIDVRADNPLLSLLSMQNCLDLFFSRFNVVYPLLHKPTFEPEKTETFLLLAVLLLGATYSDKEMHMLAVCIHDTLRAQIFQHPEFTAQPELWILQTMLLVECFGKSRAGQKQHDMSHLFHGLLIK